ncbi:response regulator receiver [Methanosarcina horonobensis HB-1 = JCM 15518]|uniref:Response regulator receiver n=1 Tax=Methanosarcina horonobensis HB-1 = JCM 15518 TaxID=1434110 RepID=A0A0E3WUK3_9EURY|nr:response regulator receiver [Methanosarcina horonobensis HB-1 = JCM 15518]
MPEIDGIEVLKILKENPVTKEIPVIALTAHAMCGDEEKFLKAGCSGYVSKPIDILKLKSMIAEFIS